MHRQLTKVRVRKAMRSGQLNESTNERQELVPITDRLIFFVDMRVNSYV